MASGGSQPTQTTSTQQTLAPEQREILDLAMPGVRDFAATVPQRYQGTTVAGFDPSQTAGQNMALDAVGAQNLLAKNAADASNFYTSGDVWNPDSNPALAGAVNAAVRPITENYQQVVRPAIRDEFQGAGQQFGGSRRGLAEGQAANAYMRNVGDTSSKLVQNEYETNVNAQLKALGLLPQTQQAQTQGAVTTSGVGDVRQNQAQQLINQDVSNFNYDQLAPFLQSQELMSLLTGIPGGGTTSVSTGNNPGQSAGSMARGALGGAASGAALGSAIMPGFGTAAGAGLGALLSFMK